MLGVKEEAGRPVVEALVKFVADRQLLVILDNCEHLVAGVRRACEAAAAVGPHVKILASSREPLARRRRDDLSGAAADRARIDGPFKRQALDAICGSATCSSSARPRRSRRFRFTDHNATAVAGHLPATRRHSARARTRRGARARAVRRADRGPRCRDRFRLLTGGDRTALPRQQTLRALIDWSYDLLTPNPSARCSDGSRSLPAAGRSRRPRRSAPAATCRERRAVLVTNLVEKSLVVLEPDGERYRLLETVRQYAQERLADSGEVDTTRARHLMFFLALAEQAKPELDGPRQGRGSPASMTSARICFGCHAWCDRRRGRRGAGVAPRVMPCGLYLLTRGPARTRAHVDARGAGAPGRSGANSCAAAPFDAPARSAASWAGTTRRAHFWRRGSPIAREMGDDHRIADILQPLGVVLLGQGDRSAARAALEEALDLARKHGDRRNIAAALNSLAQFHRVEGAAGLGRTTLRRGRGTRTRDR